MKKKKIIKKKAKNVSPRRAARRSVEKSAPKKKPVPVAATQKPIGIVTHFYNHISVAIVRFKKSVRQGTMLAFRGATTNFTQAAASMQWNHKPIATAPKGKQIGIRVKRRVREGDNVFKAT